MKKDIKEYLFTFLKVFYDGMENEGVNPNLYRIDIDDKFVSELNSKIKDTLTLDDCKKLSDICFANECLKHTVMGGKYVFLQLTPSGIGLVKSKQIQIETLENRSFLKRLSDFVIEHKGVFILGSFAVFLLSLLVSLLAIIVNLKKGD